MGMIKENFKDIPVIKELEESTLDAVLKKIQLKQYKKHRQIFSKGAPLNQIYFILKGKIKIFNKDQYGREQIVWVLQKGEIFPLVGFFRDVTFPASAEAIEDTTIASIGIRDFESIIIKDPGALINLFRVMGDRIFELQARLEEQILLEKSSQIVKLLLRLCQKEGKIYQNGKCRLISEFTSTDLAKMVGTSRGSVSRTYTQLIKEQLLYKNIDGLIIEFEKLKEKFG